MPRARLPATCIGPGVSQSLLDGHLLNLRKERDLRTGAEDWATGVENHLGLAKTYARLAAIVGERKPVVVSSSRVPNLHTDPISRGLGVTSCTRYFRNGGYV